MTKPIEKINDAQGIMRDVAIDIVSLATLLRETLVKVEALEALGVDVTFHGRYNTDMDAEELADLVKTFEQTKVSGTISMALEEV